jgi:hypothetical protein
MPSKYVYAFGAGSAEGEGYQKPSRRQGRGPRRDEPAGCARSAGFHHHHRGLRPAKQATRQTLRQPSPPIFFILGG